MLVIDDVNYNVGIIKITRKPTQKAESLGTTLDLTKHYDVKGTYINYEVELATNKLNLRQYDELYEILTNPVESHIVTLPYGQGDLTFLARVSCGSDVLVQNYTTFKKWRKLKSYI